ncbi:hypothetical protein G6N05_15345 [Flavobacterium sp. F372]|jgi:hypothetical protein|uniref:Uncharacterized protein n=1 Tax=Flavobacterium bernardetii TaxID=2813823 RepID=A0ABR7J2J5_9FLAO|nr:hypothetical protein [Flavobacterium bernardetii]MBC5836280.1 hypothetical protein [Flavobacterium bernardetii]NHF71486.1 hypothetical protein [Flavobacterium bernardetii]
MKNLLIITVFTILCVLYCGTSYGQKNGGSINNSMKNYNLPPGVVLQMKGIEEKDLSFKLNSVDYEKNELVVNFLRKFSSEEIKQMEIEKGKDYYYYKVANEYFLSLSEKIRKIYSYDELWYIYMFDQNLKNRLTTIK